MKINIDSAPMNASSRKNKKHPVSRKQLAAAFVTVAGIATATYFLGIQNGEDRPLADGFNLAGQHTPLTDTSNLRNHDLHNQKRAISFFKSGLGELTPDPVKEDETKLIEEIEQFAISMGNATEDFCSELVPPSERNLKAFKVYIEATQDAVSQLAVNPIDGDLQKTRDLLRFIEKKGLAMVFTDIAYDPNNKTTTSIAYSPETQTREEKLATNGKPLMIIDDNTIRPYGMVIANHIENTVLENEHGSPDKVSISLVGPYWDDQPSAIIIQMRRDKIDRTLETADGNTKIDLGLPTPSDICR